MNASSELTIAPKILIALITNIKMVTNVSVVKIFTNLRLKMMMGHSTGQKCHACHQGLKISEITVLSMLFSVQNLSTIRLDKCVLRLASIRHKRNPDEISYSLF